MKLDIEFHTRHETAGNPTNADPTLEYDPRPLHRTMSVSFLTNSEAPTAIVLHYDPAASGTNACDTPTPASPPTTLIRSAAESYEVSLDSEKIPQ